MSFKLIIYPFIAYVIACFIYVILLPISILTVSLGLFLLLLALFLYNMTRWSVTEVRTFRSASRQHCQMMLLNLVGYFMNRKLMKSTINPMKHQTDFVMSILKTNKDTHFGKKYNFSEINDVSAYRSKLPLSCAKDYEIYSDMIQKDNRAVLTASDPVCLAVTSGTSGKASILPSTKRQSFLFLIYGVSVFYHRLLKTYQGSNRLQKTLKLMFQPRWRYTESGLRIGPNSSNPNDIRRMLHSYTTPEHGFEINHEPSCLYIHLLFALKDPHLGCIEGNFASNLWSATQFLSANWNSLVKDIENGTINYDLEHISDDIRKSLEALCKPDPIRADQLKKAISHGRKGLFRRVWPQINLILCVNTGAFQLYDKFLKDGEAFGIPIYSPIYAATEGLIGINLWPKQDSLSENSSTISSNKEPNGVYMLIPGSMFYEFIPVENAVESEYNENTVLMNEVKVGCSYELVITNVSGLYRYKLGDVVKINRMENNCPVVEYLYRKGTLLNVRGEKLSEDYFFKCLSASLTELNLPLVEYSCVESPLYEAVSSSKSDAFGKASYYVVLIELSTNDKMDCSNVAEKLDAHLCEENYVYSSFRTKTSIGTPVIIQLRQGAFAELRRYILENTETSANQFKIPRVLRRETFVQFILECQV